MFEDSEPPSGWRLASDDPELSINFSEPRCVILPYNPQTLKVCQAGSGSNGSNGDVEMANVSGDPFSSHHQGSNFHSFEKQFGKEP